MVHRTGSTGRARVTRQALTVCVAVAVALVLAGCGGDDDDTAGLADGPARAADSPDISDPEDGEGTGDSEPPEPEATTTTTIRDPNRPVPPEEPPCDTLFSVGPADHLGVPLDRYDQPGENIWKDDEYAAEYLVGSRFTSCTAQVPGTGDDDAGYAYFRVRDAPSPEAATQFFADVYSSIQPDQVTVRHVDEALVWRSRVAGEKKSAGVGMRCQHRVVQFEVFNIETVDEGELVSLGEAIAERIC